MGQDEKLAEISENLAVVVSDIKWLRESWDTQHQWCQRNEDRLSCLELDMAKSKSKHPILMIIISILTAILAGILGWGFSKW
ncbi:MAG: hypothetical protein ACNYVW_00455 [Methanosarcinales archaeon]